MSTSEASIHIHPSVQRRNEKPERASLRSRDFGVERKECEHERSEYLRSPERTTTKREARKGGSAQQKFRS